MPALKQRMRHGSLNLNFAIARCDVHNVGPPVELPGAVCNVAVCTSCNSLGIWRVLERHSSNGTPTVPTLASRTRSLEASLGAWAIPAGGRESDINYESIGSLR